MKKKKNKNKIVIPSLMIDYLQEKPGQQLFTSIPSGVFNNLTFMFSKSRKSLIVNFNKD